MPRYFFHLSDGLDFVDPDGSELAGPEEARTMAATFLAEMLRDRAGVIAQEGRLDVVVTDEAAARLFSVSVLIDVAPPEKGHDAPVTDPG